MLTLGLEAGLGIDLLTEVVVNQVVDKLDKPDQLDQRLLSYYGPTESYIRPLHRQNQLDQRRSGCGFWLPTPLLCSLHICFNLCLCIRWFCCWANRKRNLRFQRNHSSNTGTKQAFPRLLTNKMTLTALSPSTTLGRICYLLSEKPPEKLAKPEKQEKKYSIRVA